MVSNCQICGHPDYLPSGCCHWYVIRSIEKERDTLRAELATKNEEITQLNAWVSDLQSGMYVNCIYCGHQYGPKSDTPVSMADVLKAHVEQCPKHPMSALKTKLACAEFHSKRFAGMIARLTSKQACAVCPHQNDKHDMNCIECCPWAAARVRLAAVTREVKNA